MKSRVDILGVKSGHLDIWGDGKAKVKHGACLFNGLGTELDL